jgi:hypothetical protein
MTRFSLFGAVIVVSAALSTPVLAQAAIQEPGAYAFYNSNGDLGLGSSQRVDAAARLKSAIMSHPVSAKRVRSGTRN